MFDFIQGYDLKNIRSKLFLLYMLNVSDLMFTFLLLKSGFFIEANYLMANVVHNFTSSILLKVIFPGLLLILLYYRMQQASNNQLKKSNRLINMALAVYSVINVSHIIWSLLLPIIKD